jgi:hypothetical protein
MYTEFEVVQHVKYTFFCIAVMDSHMQLQSFQLQGGATFLWFCMGIFKLFKWIYELVGTLYGQNFVLVMQFIPMMYYSYYV